MTTHREFSHTDYATRLTSFQSPRDLNRPGRWPVAGAFPRAPIGVKPVATPGDTLHQDDVVQYHRNGHQARQRMPATTVF